MRINLRKTAKKHGSANNACIVCCGHVACGCTLNTLNTRRGGREWPVVQPPANRSVPVWRRTDPSFDPSSFSQTAQ